MNKAPALINLKHQHIVLFASARSILIHFGQVSLVCGHVTIHEVLHLQRDQPGQPAGRTSNANLDLGER